MGIFEGLLIVLVILLIVGPKQIPKLTKAVSDSAKEIKKEMKSDENVSVAETTSEKAATDSKSDK